MSKARDLADGTFDTDTLVVDAANNRVGVGTASPTSKLSVSDPTYLSSSATLGSSITLNSENTASWLGTRELISFESVGNGADHRTGTLSIKLKKGNSDTTLTEYMQINAVSNYTTFSTAATERIRIDSDGLKFNGDTAAANALSDYEEGSSTITLQGSTAQPSPLLSTTCYYTKIGDQVLFNFSFEGVNTTGYSGDIYFTGLPFTNTSLSRAVINVALYDAGSWTDNLMGVIDQSQSVLSPRDIRSGQGWLSVIHSAGGGKYIWASGVYKTT